MKLYGHPMSTCTRKVLTVLAEKKHPFEMVVIDFAKAEHKGPEHMARHPWGKIPVFEGDDGRQIYESRAISRHLNATLPGTNLVPKDPWEAARMEMFVSIEQSYVSPHAGTFLHAKIFPMMRGAAIDEAKCEAARKGIALGLDVLDKELAGKKWLAGEQFTLAEAFLAPYFDTLVKAQESELITSRKNLASWWESVSSHPAWKTANGG